jgi:hypothetical protein
MNTQTVMVYGAYGHTGRFVVAELLQRGLTPVLSGRDPAKLNALARSYPQLQVRPASIDDPASLDQAVAGVDAVINTAGPFADTAGPGIGAAVRAGIPYVDVAAEIEANLDTFRLFAGPAREAGVVVVPAMAFFGGLGDLLVTAALGDWTEADEVHVAYGLDSWLPTPGTRVAGAVSRKRREGRRVRYAGGRLEYRDDPAPSGKWEFPAPLGTREVIGEFSMADIVTVPSHLSVGEVRNHMTVEAVRDLTGADTPARVGAQAQSFVVDVVVRAGSQQRRVIASGQDIYAVSAPLAVEAVQRILSGRIGTTGVASAGAIFDARDFLAALSPAIAVEFEAAS